MVRIPYVSVVLFLLLIVGPAAADEKPESQPKPLTEEQAADAVVVAVKAKDDAALKALAEKDQPDPWLVADDLLAREEFDAADSFARAASRKDTERLADYVDVQRAEDPEPEARAILEAMHEALGQGHADVALAAAPGALSTKASVVAILTSYAHGMALSALQRLEESSAAFLQSGTTAEEMGWLAKAAMAYHESGLMAALRSDFPVALDAWERRLAVEQARKNSAGLASTLANIGTAHQNRGDYTKALAYQERSLALVEEMGDRAGAATTLCNIGLIQMHLGNFPSALAHQERSLALKRELGDADGEAFALASIGLVYKHLGNHTKALGYLQRGLAISQERGGDEDTVQTLRQSLGDVYCDLEDFERALSHLGEALSLSERLSDRAGTAQALGSIGLVYMRKRDYAEALSYLGRALELSEVIGDRLSVAESLGRIGEAHRMLGDRTQAIHFVERAVREARRLRTVPELVSLLSSLAHLRLDGGDYGRALVNAQQAVSALEDLLGGLAEDEGAEAREQYADVFALGVLAAARLGEEAQALFFLESGRAGALLDSLDGRQALRWTDLPEAVRKAQNQATERAAQARVAYEGAMAAGGYQLVRAKAEALDVAREELRDVAARIQREAKALAGLYYPRAATLEEVQASLIPGQALVLYGLCINEALALVLTAESARIVSLGDVEALRAACEALDARDVQVDAAPALTKLRKMLVVPLALPEATTTVLISPEGALCYLPFGALFDPLSVAVTPSGTTHLLLSEEGPVAAKGVLALGDPQYESEAHGPRREVQRGSAEERWSRLNRLPATRMEANGVGDVVLLGDQATERGFRVALKQQTRWRAVHLACHGLVDLERPTWSSLALTREGEDDGFLTGFEVLQMKIPADLVVLSACDTAKGRILKGEGIVGLTRAFMYAGAARVICSLWKVDDEATQALMLKFYELWNPDDGNGLSAAVALRRAQKYVRSHEKWKHPYYWAAWVLWGLPE